MVSRLEKIKLENIRKANELLDSGHAKKYPNKEVILKPSYNVTSNSSSFIKRTQLSYRRR